MTHIEALIGDIGEITLGGVDGWAAPRPLQMVARPDPRPLAAVDPAAALVSVNALSTNQAEIEPASV